MDQPKKKPRGTANKQERKELEIIRLLDILDKFPPRKVHTITENDLNRSYPIYQRGEM
jgi:hypothetical protein